MTMVDEILQKVAAVPIPKFFVTVEFPVVGKEMPEHLEDFLWEKYELILHGANGRKFVYREGDWRMILTFFPTDRIVDEHYALKNKVQIKK